MSTPRRSQYLLSTIVSFGSPRTVLLKSEIINKSRLLNTQISAAVLILEMIIMTDT